MTIVEATKLRIEELCNERGLNFCRLATISGVPYTTVKSIVYNQSKNLEYVLGHRLLLLDFLV